MHQALSGDLPTVLFGESAGGLVVAALALRDAGDTMPSRLAALAHVGPDRRRHFSHLAAVDADYSDTTVLLQPAAAYAGTTLDHPLVSPLFAGLAGLPATLVQVGNREVLLGIAPLRRRAVRGVPVELTVLDGGCTAIRSGTSPKPMRPPQLAHFLGSGLDDA